MALLRIHDGGAEDTKRKLASLRVQLFMDRFGPSADGKLVACDVGEEWTDSPALWQQAGVANKSRPAFGASSGGGC